MTKQHFIRFAQEIRQEQNRDVALAQARLIAKLAYEFNPKFDILKFQIACGF